MNHPQSATFAFWFSERWIRVRLASLIFAVAAVKLLDTAAFGEVSLPSIFSDHMVLQRELANKVWGWADPGEEIAVSIADQEHYAQAGNDGSWILHLQPMGAGGPYSMTVTGENTITIEDVLVGEVWICSGQSNMAWEVKQSNYADLEIAAANFPRIRLISVPRKGSQTPQSDFEGSWAPCSPESVRDFSAVGYAFGKKLHGALQVPIGLIDNAWGGSAAEAWVRCDLLERDPRFHPLLESWRKKLEGYDHEAELSEFRKQIAIWHEEGQVRERPRWPPNLETGNKRPSNIYSGVLYPTIGYGMKGAIWYQGESNVMRAHQYRELFPLLVENWREDWGIGDFPFYYVQLADFMQEAASPGESRWAELREAQTMAMDRLENVGQVVTIDLGDGRDIHPWNKQEVGMRLASWALSRDYGYEIPHRSPQYRAAVAKEGRVVVDFDYVGEGLFAKDAHEVRGFAIAGESRNWHWANARILDEDTVEVWSDQVEHPVAVRYAWADNPVANVYSSHGLPATPFRTDEWPSLTQDEVK